MKKLLSIIAALGLLLGAAATVPAQERAPSVDEVEFVCVAQVMGLTQYIQSRVMYEGWTLGMLYAEWDRVNAADDIPEAVDKAGRDLIRAIYEAILGLRSSVQAEADAYVKVCTEYNYKLLSKGISI